MNPTIKKILQCLIPVAVGSLVVWLLGDDASAPPLKDVTTAGIISMGLLGSVRKKVGPVVSATWKGINYLRSYVIPANPNTPNQQIQRSRMRSIVDIARQLLPSVLQPYWDPFAVKMSGYNYFVSQNIMLLNSSYELTTANLMAKGNLLGVANLQSTYSTSNGALNLNWDDNSNGTTGLSSDLLFFVTASKSGNVLSMGLTSASRSDRSFNDTLPPGLTASSLITYAFFVRGSGSSVSVSDSAAVVNTAP